LLAYFPALLAGSWLDNLASADAHSGVSRRTAFNLGPSSLSFLRGLLNHLSQVRRRFISTGVRSMGPNSLVVQVDHRSYWVRAQVPTDQSLEYHVWTSDIRDITNAATVVAAPPAPAAVVPEVRERLAAHFDHSRVKVRFY
jgi:hypothetical protein